MDSSEQVEPPLKRIKLSPERKSQEIHLAEETPDEPTPSTDANTTEGSATGKLTDEMKEIEVGISEYVDSMSSGFRGTLKKRYTDFLVNEILPNGEVLHLRNLIVSKAARGQRLQGDFESRSEPAAETPTPAQTNGEAFQAGNQHVEPAIQSIPSHPQDSQNHAGVKDQYISAEDKALLVSYFGGTPVDELLALYQRILTSPEAKSRDLGNVKTTFTSDRSVRGQIHQSIRRIFGGKVDSTTDHEGILVLSAIIPEHRRPANQPGRNNWKKPNRPTWDDRGGEYLHFTLYKENKDTMEVVSFLSRQVQIQTRNFQFAGTKDRRAVSVQRVSIRRVEAERLVVTNRTLRNASVGDFEYHKHGLDLGDLKGNEFVITLLDCEFEFDQTVSGPERLQLAKNIVEVGLHNLHERGFFNYFGLQRFGTFSTRTDTIGMKLLQGDFKGACDDILEFSPKSLAAADDSQSTDRISSDDRNRAQAINGFKVSGRSSDAISMLPYKFSAEAALIKHLGRHPTDYQGALVGIQRNLRLMYVHAYQSFVWNMAVGERWRLYGDKVAEGDLVMVNEHQEVNGNGTTHEEVDADGEAVIRPSFDDRAHAVDDVFERARALTAEEASSGDYTIFDVVLPQPGYDIMYPKNEMDDWYKTFMSSKQGGGLDPYDMRRKQNDYSLSGAYRKFLTRIEPEYGVEVRSYTDENEQFVMTDLARLQSQEASEEGASGSTEQDRAVEYGEKLAVVLKFQLRSSQYATMALRELSKGGITAHKPDFSGGR